MAISGDNRRYCLYLVLCFVPNFSYSTEIDLNFFATTQVWMTKSSIFVTFVIISRYYVNQFEVFSRHSSMAFESWSGQDVGLKPHRMPRIREMGVHPHQELGNALQVAAASPFHGNLADYPVLYLHPHFMRTHPAGPENMLHFTFFLSSGFDLLCISLRITPE